MTPDSKVGKTKLKREVEPEQRAVLYTDRTPNCVVLNAVHLPRAFQQLTVPDCSGAYGKTSGFPTECCELVGRVIEKG